MLSIATTVAVAVAVAAAVALLFVGALLVGVFLFLVGCHDCRVAPQDGRTTRLFLGSLDNAARLSGTLGFWIGYRYVMGDRTGLACLVKIGGYCSGSFE